MSYPNTIDSFPTHVNGEIIDASYDNSQQTAIVAVETKVGVTGSAVTTTVDYKLTNTASIDPGHKHTPPSGGTGNYTYVKGDILAASNSTTLNRIPVGTDGQQLISDSSQVSGVSWGTAAQNFGDGSDGNVTISSPTTITRDMYYDTLTVNNVLTTDGFMIYCKTLITGTGTIQWGTPNNGNNGSGNTAGTGATQSGTGKLKSVVGGNGSNGSSAGGGSAPTSAAGSTKTASPGVNGVSGGAGGSGSTGDQSSGGAGGTASTYSKVGVLSFTTLQGIDLSLTGISVYDGSAGSSGGGGGSQDAANSGSGGGGGGAGASGGGVIVIAKSWAGTFIIKSIGGTGGTGGIGTAGGGSANTGGGGGGAGGAGGWSIVVYSSKTWTGSYNLVGGTGGTGGAGHGSGSTGVTGTTGTTGSHYEIISNNLTR